MEIEIIGTETLGVRGMCCFVRTKNRRILIDPGIALGYHRYGLLPHPFQVAVDERTQKKIVKRWAEATDIVISHFHGEHTPLPNANPYQFSVNKVIGLNPTAKIWTKSPSHLSPIESQRAKALSEILNKDFDIAEGMNDGPITFSKPVIHGDMNDTLTTVIMVRIEEDRTFVHAAGIQLLNDRAVSQILDWKPDVALVDGPPLYLFHRISERQIEKAWYNAKELSRNIDTLILDHHLMRSHKGIEWIERLSDKTGRKVLCGADFMHKHRMLLEAGRRTLYNEMPVPVGWHEAYAKKQVSTNQYWESAKKFLKFAYAAEIEKNC